jgi:hypothetical protein
MNSPPPPPLAWTLNSLYVEIKCQLDATNVFYCRSYCLLNVFRAPLCPSSGAGEYYTVGCRLWSLVLGFQVVGMVWSWGLCVRFAGCSNKICNKNSSVASSSHFISTYYRRCTVKATSNSYETLYIGPFPPFDSSWNQGLLVCCAPLCLLFQHSALWHGDFCINLRVVCLTEFFGCGETDCYTVLAVTTTRWLRRYGC